MAPEYKSFKRGVTRKQIDRYIIADAARQFSIDIVVNQYNNLIERIRNIVLNPNDDTIERTLSEAETDRENKNKIDI